jgi:hypothetical protein
MVGLLRDLRHAVDEPYGWKQRHPPTPRERARCTPRRGGHRPVKLQRRSAASQGGMLSDPNLTDGACGAGVNPRRNPARSASAHLLYPGPGPSAAAAGSRERVTPPTGGPALGHERSPQRGAVVCQLPVGEGEEPLVDLRARQLGRVRGAVAALCAGRVGLRLRPVVRSLRVSPHPCDPHTLVSVVQRAAGNSSQSISARVAQGSRRSGTSPWRAGA